MKNNDEAGAVNCMRLCCGENAPIYEPLPIFGGKALVYIVEKGTSGDTEYTDRRIIECVRLFLEKDGKKCAFSGDTGGTGNTDSICVTDDDTDDITVIRDEYGKPHCHLGKSGKCIREIYVSVTHSGTVMAVAVSERSIGIDAEESGRRVKNPKALSKRFFTREEYCELEGQGFSASAFLTMWVKKEALAKLIGRGIPCMKEKSVFEPELDFEKLCITGYTAFAVRTLLPQE